MNARQAALVWVGLLPLLAACVSVEEAPLGKNAVEKGQRTVLLVYPAPGPVVGEADSKGETAAKLIPGIGLAVQGAQDDRDNAASKDLRQYLPPFDAATQFYAPMLAELQKTPSEGKWTTAEEAGFSTVTLRAFNQADSLSDWRHKYDQISYEHETPARDYSKLLDLDDAMIFEVNLSYGLLGDGEGNYAPQVSGTARLYRASTMRQLWRHEETAVDGDAAARKMLYDHKTAPVELVRRWKALLPQLAQKLAADFARSTMGLPDPTAVAETPAPSLFGSTTTAVGGGIAPAQQGLPPGAGASAGAPGYAAPGGVMGQPSGTLGSSGPSSLPGMQGQPPTH